MEKEGKSDADGRSTITVNVKFSGRSIPVEISDDSTVKRLKSLLQPLTNVLSRGQKLIFKGKVLVDEMTLKSSEVGNGAKIMLMASQGLHQGDSDDLKKQRRPFLTQFFSPILLKAFSITFFGEWGDKSQIATIGLAADENPLGVVLGGILGQALCTTAAVLGGKSLASSISERIVAFAGGFLFIIFGIQSFLTPVE